jgi:TRAP-type mannitol/chloroaromatic compound transport system permease small subunit
MAAGRRRAGHLRKLIRFIDGLNEYVGRAAAWGMLGVVLVVFAVVALRYGFNWGRVWLSEAYVWLNAAAVMLGAAYTLKHDGHVRIDIWYERWGSRGRARADLLGSLFLLLPFLLLVLYESWPYVASSWRIAERSREAGGLPGLYWLKTLIPVFAALMLLQGVVLMLRAWRELRGSDRA